MKRNLTFFLFAIYMVSTLLTSCSIANMTTQSSTTSDNACILPANTRFSSVEELTAALDDGNENVFKLIKDEGKLYYPEVKENGYSLFSIETYESCLVYTFYPNEAFEENDDMLYMDTFYPETYIVQVSYYEMTQQEAIANYTNDDTVILDDGSIYNTKVKKIFFQHGDSIFHMSIPENYGGNVTGQNFIEIKSIDVTK